MADVAVSGPTPTYQLRDPELVNLAGHETGRGHLSPSSITTLLTCQQKWMWDKERRLEPAVTAAPLQLGRAFAHALEAGDPTQGRIHVLEQAKQQRELAATSPWIAAPDEEQKEIDAQIVECAARAYLDRYGHSERRELELKARIRNPAVGGRYSLTHDVMCRVDAVDLESGVLIEDKLTGSVQRGTLAQRLRLDRQVSINAYLVWRCFGVQIEKVLYRVTLKPAIRRRKDESHHEYLDRIRADYYERPEHYLIEEPAYRTRDDFLRLEQELWRWAEALREARRSGVYPRNTSACVEYGGCRFLPLCADEPGAATQFVEKEERPVKEAA